MRMRKSMLAVGALALSTTAMAQVAPRYLNQRDVQEAAQQHRAVVEEFGGAETGARGAYVQAIGAKVGAYSGITNPGQALHYTALNSAVENAFAVPGGYVYITRQLMGLMNDEAELAFVLGHETGHIAARHAQQRESRANRNSILGVLGAVLGSVVGGGFGDLIAQGAQYSSQLGTLRFSRDQEYQADQLGIRYITSAGYDPMAGASMLSALTRATALEARVQGKSGRSTPEWASTHPLSENRVTQAAQIARQTGRMSGVRNRDAFLAQLEGAYVDDDPAQGVIDGRTFTHPDLRLQFSVPAGFQMQNSADAVTIAGTSGKAQFSTGPYNGDPSQYVQGVLYRLTEGKAQVQMGPIQRTQVNGVPAYYAVGRANTSSGAVDVGVFIYEMARNKAYHFVTLTQAGAGLNPFSSMINSFRPITAAEAAAIRPRVIDVHTVARGETVQSLASRMAYRNFQAERFLSLNGLASNAALTPGQKVKLVVYGTRRR